MGQIEYELTNDVQLKDLVDFYRRQGHPTTDQTEKLSRMVDNSFCFVTARNGGQIIGLARGITDGVRGWLVECKLDPVYQGPAAVTRTDGRVEHDHLGIAKEMAVQVIEALRDYGVSRIDVMAYGTEEDFCEELGFKRAGGVVAMNMDPADSLALQSGSA